MMIKNVIGNRCVGFFLIFILACFFTVGCSAGKEKTLTTKPILQESFHSQNPRQTEIGQHSFESSPTDENLLSNETSESHTPATTTTDLEEINDNNSETKSSPPPSIGLQTGETPESGSLETYLKDVENDGQLKARVDSEYELMFKSIQASCKEKVSNLTREVTTYIAGAKSGDGDVSIADMQNKFLGKIAAAEGECDQQFNSALAQAEQEYKDAGIEETKIAAWKSQYDSGKAQARLTAMSKILAAWKTE